MKSSNYGADINWAKTYEPLMYSFIDSNAFRLKLQRLRRKGTVSVSKVLKSDNLEFQSDEFIDCVVVLNTGSSLKVDFKVNRYNSNYPGYVVEFLSNAKGKSDGWGYHEGTTIIHAKVIDEKHCFIEEPVVYTIDRDFINDVTRNPEYGNYASPSTNNLYVSRFRSVPRTILEKYWGEKNLPPKSKGSSAYVQHTLQ
jgi:hypothetical protein